MSNQQTPPIAEVYDLAVVGGGIHGVGIAADAAGRGLRVFLCEKDDLAAHTSSASSKLIHGGLRYLEHYEFRLVREALAEREVLMAKAAHLVTPLRFILPHRPHLRPAWMIRVGLFLYDHLGARKTLPGSKGLRFGPESPLQQRISRGFEYSDCQVDDARLVIANALAAQARGAHIHCRTRCLSAHRSHGLWHLHLERGDGARFSIRARALVNAAGPWVAAFLRDGARESSSLRVRMVQGSHLVVPRLHDGEQGYILQNEDRRIVFALPYQQDFTLIGTTDREYSGDPDKVRASEEEIDYLLEVINAHFRKTLTRADIRHSFSGVRALYDDASGNPSAITRDYHLERLGSAESGLLLSIYGGKLTTYRRVAEAVLAELAEAFPQMGPAWTASATLPGGEQGLTPQQLAAQLGERAAWLPATIARRWAASYGSRVWDLLGDAREVADLDEEFGAGLHAREVDFLCRTEWAVSAEDILWRRSKLGLRLDAGQQARLENYLVARSRPPQARPLPRKTLSSDRPHQD